MILRPRQTQLVERAMAALHQHGNTLAVAPTGCHALDTPILMFDGTVKAVQDIAVGDQLMGPDSTPRRVLELHRGQDEMFEIRPMKGESFVVNAGHILTLVRTNDGKSKGAGQLIDIALQDYLAASDYFRHLHKLQRVAVDFPCAVELPIDPYFMGVLLGDGALKHSLSVTTQDIEVVEELQFQAQAWGVSLRVDQLQGNLANTYHLVTLPRSAPNLLLQQIQALGLHGLVSKNKFVPQAFKLGSREQRLQILAGLLDTDGHLSKSTMFEFCSRSCQLADDVCFIARSLGFQANLRRKVVNNVDYWRVHLSGYCEQIPTRVIRKKASPRRQIKNVLRTGFTVHPVGRDHYYGFSVDGDQRYVMGDFTVTHNSGKTIMLSALAGKILTEPDAKACILAHRTELTSQNRSKFERVNPKLSTSVYDASEKSWAGSATFAMVQTLSRKSNLSQIPTLDLLVVDEAHHCASPSYRAVIEAAQKKNPKLLLAGLTATPNRGDGKGLREVFSNVADQITLGEMIAAGHLVPPRTFVIDVGAQEALGKVRRTADDFDMREVASILNSQVINDAVVTHWKEKAGGRKTIVFCSTVAHANDVCRAFNAAGVNAVLIHGELSDTDRKERLAEYETGKAQVVVNVAVLTEGYDYTPTSCVVLLRPSSYKSTLIQMIGRGLRTVDPEEFPGVVKTDCVVLDFGTATLMHGNLEQTAVLDGAPVGDAKHKTCPECEAQVPLAAHACALCGYEWPRDEPEEREGKARDPLDTFVMSEIDLLSRSNFLWCDLFGQDDTLMATGFNAWGGVFFLAGHWYAVGGGKGLQTRLLNMGDRTLCLARADDWLNEHENEDAAHKTRRWVNQPATDKQMQYLPPEMRMDFDLSRYQASVHMSFVFNKKRIQTLVMQAAKSAALREVA